MQGVGNVFVSNRFYIKFNESESKLQDKTDAKYSYDRSDTDFRSANPADKKGTGFDGAANDTDGDFRQTFGKTNHQPVSGTGAKTGFDVIICAVSKDKLSHKQHEDTQDEGVHLG